MEPGTPPGTTAGRRSSLGRTVLAVVLAPVLGLIVGTIILDSVGDIRRGAKLGLDFFAFVRAIPFFVGWGSVLAYPATLLVLLPAHLLLVRANRVGWGWYMLAGIVLVLAATAITGTRSGKVGTVAYVWFIYAMPTALFFRAIAIRRVIDSADSVHPV
jgi:hypothetical protein